MITPEEIAELARRRRLHRTVQDLTDSQELRDFGARLAGDDPGKAAAMQLIVDRFDSVRVVRPGLAKSGEVVDAAPVPEDLDDDKD